MHSFTIQISQMCFDTLTCMRSPFIAVWYNTFYSKLKQDDTCMVHICMWCVLHNVLRSHVRFQPTSHCMYAWFSIWVVIRSEVAHL